MFEDPVAWTLDGNIVRDRDAVKAQSITTCKTPVMVNGERKLPCYATFKTGPTECPYCGIPLQKQARKVEVQEGELSEVPATQERKYTPNAMLAIYAALRKIQDERNYKPTYALAVFKSKFGHFPPGQWRDRSLEELEAALPKRMPAVQL
jgi:hypothetical protein